MSPRAIARIVLCVGLAVLAATIVRLALRSDTFLMEQVVLDDTAYFAKLASNLVAGRGYTLDGRHVTNGVQPFFAGLAILLATFVRDDGNLLRALVLLGGLAWLGGAAILARLLRRQGTIASVTAALGMAMAGVEGKLALTGMENGVHALLVAATVWSAEALRDSPVGSPQQWRRALWFGGCIAALSLNRVEYGLLAAVLVVWLLRGVALAGDRQAWRRLLLPMLLPLVLGGLLWAVPSLWGTGSVLPISGAAKAVANERAAAAAIAAGTAVGLGERLLQLAQQFVLHAFGAQSTVAVVQAAWLGVPLTWLVNLPWLVLAAAGVAFAALLAPARAESWAIRRLVGMYALLHVALIAHFLGYHVAYCSWYSPGEVFCLWLGAGRLLGALRQPWLRPLQLLLALLALQPLGWRLADWWRRPPTFPEFSSVVQLGHWLEHNVAAGARVGVFNAGLVAVTAPSLAVTNLDGLVNDRRYLDEYYRANRIADYIRDERLDLVADVAALADGQAVVRSLAGDGARVAYVRRTSVDQAAFAVVRQDATAAVRLDPLANVLFDAWFAHRGAIVATDALAALGKDQRVVASFVVPPGDQPQHVVLPRAAARAAVTLGPDSAVQSCRDFALGPLQLAATRLPDAAVLPGAVVPITVYCRVGQPLSGPVELTFRIGGAEEFASTRVPAIAERREALAYGTVGAGESEAPGLVAHCTFVRLPDDVAGGELPVWFGVRRAGAVWATYRLGTLRVAP